MTIRRSARLTTGRGGIQSTPVVAKDTVIVGAAFARNDSMKNNKGYVRDSTCARASGFGFTPSKGGFGYDTWLNDSRVHGKHGCVDANPVRMSNSDWSICRWVTHERLLRRQRPGNNLFGEAWYAWI
jgi:quinoprotein glucose dehydrogenase